MREMCPIPGAVVDDDLSCGGTQVVLAEIKTRVIIVKDKRTERKTYNNDSL